MPSAAKEFLINKSQLRGRAVFGQVATNKAKLCGGRARFHSAHHVIEPRTARFFESVQIVYRDECEIVVAGASAPRSLPGQTPSDNSAPADNRSHSRRVNAVDMRNAIQSRDERHRMIGGA